MTDLQRGEWFINLIGSGVGFLIGVFITRWIFGIPELVKNQRSLLKGMQIQVKLLKIIAEKSGATPEEIEKATK